MLQPRSRRSNSCFWNLRMLIRSSPMDAPAVQSHRTTQATPRDANLPTHEKPRGTKKPQGATKNPVPRKAAAYDATKSAHDDASTQVIFTDIACISRSTVLSHARLQVTTTAAARRALNLSTRGEKRHTSDRLKESANAVQQIQNNMQHPCQMHT